MAWRSLFSREPAPLLGVDLGASSIRLVELSHPRSGCLTLERVATQPLQPGWLIDGHIDSFDEVAQALRRLVDSCGSQTREVAMALPASAVMARTVVLPAGLASQERLIRAEAEAAEFIPFALDEVSLDVCETGQVTASGDGAELLIVAARKDMVSDRQALAEAAGLRAVVVDVAPYASRRAARRVIETVFETEQAQALLIALFELGSHSLGLQVLRDEAVLFERQQPLGDAPDELPRAVVLALQFFFTSTPHNRVDQVLLAGGRAGWPGLCEAVTAHTGAACSVVNPFEGMAVGAACASAWPSPADAPAYLRATGLALRRFHR